MNGLSWLLYAAELSDRAHNTFSPIAVLSGTALLGTGLFRAITSVSRDEWADGVPELARKALRINISVFVVALAIALFLPTKSTIMLIAASQVGETIISTKEAQALGGEAGQLATDSLRLLRKYVSEQLAD